MDFFSKFYQVGVYGQDLFYHLKGWDSGMQARHHMKDATNMTAKLKVSHHKWNFNKLEAAHAINHMKDATNIALHILKVSRHID